MTGYFTDLLLNNDLENDPLSKTNDNFNTTIPESQHSLYLPTTQPLAPIPIEQLHYSTDPLDTATTVENSTHFAHSQHSFPDLPYHQDQQEQQSGQVSDNEQKDSQRTTQYTRDSIMTAIENTLLEIFASLAMLKPVELPFMARTLRRSINTGPSSSTGPSTSDDPLAPPDQDAVQDFSEPRLKILSLGHVLGATTLTRYVRVLELIYDSLANNVMMTKRDIFYRDLPLFRSQKNVDKIVDDICCHYNVPRSTLNVSASGKGRIYGPAMIILKNHRILNCLADANDDDLDCNDEYGVLIPPINQVLDIDCRARFVIVIEKEASFRNLVSVGFVQMLLQQCILVTGCGYPDFATRHLVKHISLRYPKMPILAVMDGDPYGMDIYSVYKWGSLAQAHDSVNLTIPSMVLLGLGCDDRKEYRIPEDVYVPLTSKDREKGIRMIMASQQLQHGQTSTVESDAFILELSKMLHMNQKCELQALVTDGPLGFIDYLRMKIERYMNSLYSY